MTAFEAELAANASYAETFDGADLTAPADKGLAVVTCMDSRIDPLAVLGLGLGDAKVLRNPGGQVTEEVLVALVLAVHLLEVTRVLVLQHTGCKMASVSEDEAHDLLSGLAGTSTRDLRLRTIPDQRAALERDVEAVVASPHLPAGIAVAGGLYDVATGRVELLVERTSG
jgi:carbonic anhydrase